MSESIVRCRIMEIGTCRRICTNHVCLRRHIAQRSQLHQGLCIRAWDSYAAWALLRPSPIDSIQRRTTSSSTAALSPAGPVRAEPPQRTNPQGGSRTALSIGVTALPAALLAQPISVAAQQTLPMSRSHGMGHPLHSMHCGAVRLRSTGPTWPTPMHTHTTTI